MLIKVPPAMPAAIGFAALRPTNVMARQISTCKEYVLDDFWMHYNNGDKVKLTNVCYAGPKLSQKIKTVEKFIHAIERHFGVKKLSEFVQSKNHKDLYIVRFSRYWSNKTYRLSFYLWILRLAEEYKPGFHQFKDNEGEFEVTSDDAIQFILNFGRLKQYHRDRTMAERGKNRLKKILLDKNWDMYVKGDWKAYMGTGDVHGNGGWYNGYLKDGQNVPYDY